jgi:hypothetical protein
LKAKFEKSWSLRIELITGVNALCAAKLILSDRKYQKLKGHIPDYLRNWIHKYSESFENWSKYLCAISYSDMAPLTEKQRCQVLIEALQGFKEAMLEARRASEDYYIGNDAASQDEFIKVITRIDGYLDSLQSILREKKPEHCP